MLFYHRKSSRTFWWINHTGRPSSSSLPPYLAIYVILVYWTWIIGFDGGVSCNPMNVRGGNPDQQIIQDRDRYFWSSSDDAAADDPIDRRNRAVNKLEELRLMLNERLSASSYSLLDSAGDEVVENRKNTDNDQNHFVLKRADFTNPLLIPTPQHHPRRNHHRGPPEDDEERRRRRARRLERKKLKQQLLTGGGRRKGQQKEEQGEEEEDENNNNELLVDGYHQNSYYQKMQGDDAVAGRPAVLRPTLQINANLNLLNKQTADKIQALRHIQRQPDEPRRFLAEFAKPNNECPKQRGGGTQVLCPSRGRRGYRVCIPDTSLCNGRSDCPNGEDEDPVNCLFYKTTIHHFQLIVDAVVELSDMVKRHDKMHTMDEL